MPQVPDPQGHVLSDVPGRGLTRTGRDDQESREATSVSTVARLPVLTVDPAQGHVQGRTREVAVVAGLVKGDTTGTDNSGHITTIVALTTSRGSKPTTIKITGVAKTSKTEIGSTIISRTIGIRTVEAVSSTDTIITTTRIIVVVGVGRIEVAGSSTITGKADSAIIAITTGENSEIGVPTREIATATGAIRLIR